VRRARWLVDQGVADPSRLCIVGWSYGGYAAQTGVAKEPQLVPLLGTDKAELQIESPLRHADGIKVAAPWPRRDRNTLFPISGCSSRTQSTACGARTCASTSYVVN
jgi:hypothetical protein